MEADAANSPNKNGPDDLRHTRPPGAIERIRLFLIAVLGVALSLFTVYEVNYAMLPPLSQLAIFCMLGSVLCFLMYPLHPRLKDKAWPRLIDFGLSAGIVICCGYLLAEGTDLADRAGRFTETDFAVAIAGTLLVLEATRRSIGMALPILAGVFLLYAYFGASLPDGLFPHRGYSIDRIATQCFLRTEGVFSIAMRVMFTYVFLFVVFGAFLEMSGATQFIIDFAQRVFDARNPLLRFVPRIFRNVLTVGGPAKVSVLSSGLMGSLSGSAVANAVTTGTFTIPMMRSAGFQRHVAGGITAAAASGGALVPPVMGAGAYMMLELVENVTFLQIATAALIPAVLYYFSILTIVHFYAQRAGAANEVPARDDAERRSLVQYEGLVFFGALGALIGFLILNYTPFRAVTYSLEVILLLTIVSPRMKVTKANRVIALVGFALMTLAVGVLRSQLNVVASWLDLPMWKTLVGWIGIVLRSDANVQLADWTTWADAGIPGMILVLLLGITDKAWRPMILEAFRRAARGGVSLVSASACVGVVIGVVSLTGVGTAFPNAVIPLAEESLFLALLAIMVCSIILGMGLPSAVCYLLMATLIGPVLNKLGVIPLAAHLFIFYFGMMSMVTPPVALAAYASASIAGSKIMRTGLSAFLFALVGFTLPFMFVYRPELLLLSNKPELANVMFHEENTPDTGTITGALRRGGEPVAGVEMKLVGDDGEELRTESDVSGRFRLTLETGQWQVWLNHDGELVDVGQFDVDPQRPAAPPELAGDVPSDQRVIFTDRRLSIVQVVVATCVAALGIVALAAGIAGYMLSPMNPLMRALAFGTAALLLFPGQGIPLAGIRIAVSDLVGLALFAVVVVWNQLASKRNADQAQNVAGEQ